MQKVEPYLNASEFEKAPKVDERTDGQIRTLAKNILQDDRAKEESAHFRKKENVFVVRYKGQTQSAGQTIDLIVDSDAMLMGYRIITETSTVYKCVAL